MQDTQQEGLVRQLGKLDLFCIAAGAMISSGLFVLPGLVYAKVGPAVILAYIFAGILVLPALFTKAELTTAMPRAGGSYFFIERSMGATAGTIGGFASWLSLSLKSAFSLIGIGAFATLVNPNLTEWHIKIIAAGFCVFFTVLNLISVKITGKTQVFLVMLLIGALFLYIFRGSISLDVHKYTPFMPFGSRRLFAAAGMVFVSFGGLTKVASVAEEARDPARSVPYSMILAFCVILLLYGLAVFVTVGLLDGEEFAHSLTPISAGGYKLFGTAGRLIMAFAAILAFVSTANAGILAASRFPMAMSRDHLLPGFFAKVSKRFNTPCLSVVFTGIFMTAVILFLNLENLVKVASTMKIILFMFVILASVIMRESKILNYKPTFVSPLYPWLHIAGVLCYCFLLYQMGVVSLVTTGGFFLASVLWHKLYSRGKAVRKSALVHLVERVADREIAGESLGSELREILRERDNIVEDRFDELVKRSEILEIPDTTGGDKQITYVDFFEIVAKKLSQQLNIDEKELFESLISRERESTTEIRPGLAIPHITVDGEHKFELLIARCEAGISFTEELPPVYAAFVLVGSRDERDFHLRSLSAIAQVTQDANFDKDWLRAKSIEELRDIILLAKRRRQTS